MKDDKYKPDVAKVLAAMDPVQVLERRRQGLAEFYAGEQEADPDKAPSPWAEGAVGELDKAALPSAMMPTADVPPMTTPVRTRRAKRTWPASWKLVGGLALTAAVMFGLAVGVLAGRAKEQAKIAAATSAAVAGSGVPSVRATEVAPAVTAPSATAAPSVMPAPVLVEPDAGAAPVPRHGSPPRPPIHLPATARPVANDILP